MTITFGTNDAVSKLAEDTAHRTEARELRKGSAEGSTFDRIQRRCYTPAIHERRLNRSGLVSAPERTGEN